MYSYKTSSGRFDIEEEKVDRRRESNVTTETETGVMTLEVKECLQPPKTPKMQVDSSLRPPEEAEPSQHLDFGPVKLILNF